MRSILICLLVVTVQFSRADIIECDNGDRYNGKILSMDAETVKLQNEIAGTLTIPRNRIVGINLRQAPAQTATATATKAATNGPALDPKKIQFDPASIERIQNEFLGSATPEASQLFQQMIQGLQSQQLNLGDIRSQAATTLKELREMQKELGDDELGGMLESYGAILETFLKQAPASTPAPANKPQRR